MAKQRKLLVRQEASTPVRRSESISLSSTQQLGRAIAVLQRELDGAIRRFNEYTSKRRSHSAEAQATDARRRRRRSIRAATRPK